MEVCNGTSLFVYTQGVQVATKAIRMARPSDMHVHVRDGDMLKRVVMPTLQFCRNALIMPNTNPPKQDLRDILNYRRDIWGAMPFSFKDRPELIMALYLTTETVPGTIYDARGHLEDLVTVKYYPYGTTTMSQFGIKTLREGYPVFDAMQEVGMVLNLHGEVPDVPSYPDAEQRFLDQFLALHEAFPALRIVLEHVSSAAAVHLIKDLPSNVVASITPQHLCLTIDDVEEAGEVVHPHNACLPRAKNDHDRAALVEAATQPYYDDAPKFFLGTDSAPHLPEHKQLGAVCANGVYSGPVALPVLAGIFEGTGLSDWADRLEGFASLAGPDFYGLQAQAVDDVVLLIHEPWRVPEEINGVVPFAAGVNLPWRVYDPRRTGFGSF